MRAPPGRTRGPGAAAPRRGEEPARTRSGWASPSASPDPAALAALHAAAFVVPRPWGRDEIAALLASPAVFALHRPGGFAMGRVAAGEAELLTLAVAPAARRGGLGRALLAAFEARARARGAAAALLEVAAPNAPALALYRGAGWAEVGRRPGYHADGHGRAIDALVLRKSL